MAKNVDEGKDDLSVPVPVRKLRVGGNKVNRVAGDLEFSNLIHHLWAKHLCLKSVSSR